MPLKDPEARKAYHREYMRRKYKEDAKFRAAHQERTKKNGAVAKKRLKAIVEKFRQGGCLLCNEEEACCLSAHHTDSEGKDFNIGDAIGRRYGVKKLQKELRKCVCLCRNCHAKVHAGIVELPAHP